MSYALAFIVGVLACLLAVWVALDGVYPWSKPDPPPDLRDDE